MNEAERSARLTVPGKADRPCAGDQPLVGLEIRPFREWTREWRRWANRSISAAGLTWITPMLDRLFTDLNIATMDSARAAPYGAVENAAIGVAGGKITYVGPAKDAPAAKETTRCAGRWAS
ncbi:MAG: hypothetical protein R3C42_08160, partial [Parvularculaceae bacterium]